ncbi:hypothetical protein [Streptomyces albireticuli]|uniref:Secreted protein n=1 Tax=Streptomyces albireticuli TaxID=1940 RepID=A0A2A2D5F9_9ACTN|nr:hypothetical protein [Streptomyces albireticuli]MCD9145679.1 hypothetical protein [Streptomyces albireticuli]MCD9165589.1 hypothetical protein [Streptomyces albireticuli]MCD9195888.1 hypothetical protein [Streptomyces albireticuli]PAU46619.1 hypothetical protein CK936_23160 [Streptomyces albireticuli]
MNVRVRRWSPAAAAAALAGLWALLLVLMAGPVAAAASPSGAAVPVVTSAPSPPAAPPADPVTGPGGHLRAWMEPAAAAGPGAGEEYRVPAPEAHAVVHLQRPHGLPAVTRGPVTGPLELPLRPGEIAGPRQERAPPPAVLTSRRTRGPPFTRSS